MAEDEIMIEDDAIALEDTDESVIFDADVSSIIPFINEKYQRAEDYREQDEDRCYVPIVTTVVCMGLTCSLLKQKSLASSLK